MAGASYSFALPAPHTPPPPATPAVVRRHGLPEESLETILHSELQDAHVASRRDDLAEVAGVVVDDGGAPIEVVEQIEQLEPQLEAALRGPGDQPREIGRA